MPEVARARPRGEDFRNLRPLILTVCFVWGVVLGFTLNFFRTPENVNQAATQNQQAGQSAPDAAQSSKPMTELERRHAGTPAIAPIEPAPQPSNTNRLLIEDAVIAAPQVNLTTEGGLTGRTAPRPRLNAAAPAAPPGSTPTAVPSMPLIPDLDP